jgi:putative ABC transport system permease protein
MISNILKISIRYLLKQKVYTYINIFGLALGLATCILIFVFIQHELSYDRFHENAENVVRVEPRWVGMGEDSHWAASNGGLLPSLESRFPEINHSVKIHFNYQPSIVEYEGIAYSEERIMVADSSFFKVFSFKLLEGDPETALSGTGNVVLTKEYAIKYFGNEPALNKIIQIDDNPYKVSGIVENIPDNSHFHFNMAIALDDMRSRWSGVDQEGPSTFYSYLIVTDQQALESLSTKANEQIWEIYGFDVENDTTGVMEDYAASLIFQPITDIHLNGHAEKEIEANSNKKYVYIFLSIALFVLIIACINYMNLATARSSRRSREVGMRKVLGAGRASIFNQFMAESYILCIIAMVIALIMVELILPGFNQMTGKDLSINVLNNHILLVAMILIVIVVGFVAGSYPSLFLARLDPMKILRAGRAAGKGNKPALYLRRILVISQFTISVILIIGTITVYRQLNYFQDLPLGFEKEQVLVVSIPARGYQDKFITLKNELKNNPQINSSALISGVPGQRVPFLTVALPDATESTAEDAGSLADGFGMRVMSGDAEILKTLGIEMADGRDFDVNIQQDEKDAFIINEAAVEWLELENPVGTKFTYLYNVNPPKEGKIIGVAKNFHYASLHTEVEPVMIHVYNPYNRYLIIRLQTDNLQATITSIESAWNDVLPSIPFSHFFLDSYYDNLYKAETNVGTIITYFAILAIIIACLGLFGLVSYITEQRTKEIGIRKILGASIGSIIKTISYEFMILVLISNILAWVPAYFLMSDWLNDFAYRTSLGVWTFVLASIASFLIAFLTISFQSVKVALANPVQAIKYE